MQTTYEMLARERKVAKIVAVLRKYGVTVSDLADATREEWDAAAKKHGFNPPSDQTIALVVAELRRAR